MNRAQSKWREMNLERVPKSGTAKVEAFNTGKKI
jgi:hypothetical protein